MNRSPRKLTLSIIWPALWSVWIILPGCREAPTPPAPPEALLVNTPCVSKLSNEVRKELSRVKGKTTVRSGIVHISLPADPTEYEKMNKSAIIAIALFSQNKDDLPVTKLHLVPGAKDQKNNLIYALPSIFPKWHVTELPDAHPERILGKYKQESFFFIPIRYLREKGDLGVPFAKDTKGIPLLRFPLAMKETFILNDPSPAEDPKRPPDPDTTFALLAGHYCWGL